MTQTADIAPGIDFFERASSWESIVAMAHDQGVNVTPELAMKTSVWFACARVVAETVACLPLHLYRRLDDDTSERAKDHPLYRVLAKRPNSWQTRYEWVEQMCLHRGFYGNAYQYKVPGVRGSASELHPLHPAGMRVEQDSDKKLIYRYRDPRTGVEKVYLDGQIMHVRWLSFDGVHGELPTDIGRDVIGLARSLEQYASRFYKNNAMPGLVLTTEQVLDKKTREDLRDQWNARHQGSSKAGETAVLSNGLEAKTISATNQESQLAELWMQSLLAVCRMWRMPPHMVQELGRATWGNLSSEMVSFEKFTIAPWLRSIEGAIERDILGDDDEYYAEFLVEGLLRSDITTRYSAYDTAVKGGWMTVEEVRRKENMGPLPEPPPETVPPEPETEPEPQDDEPPTEEPADE